MDIVSYIKRINEFLPKRIKNIEGAIDGVHESFMTVAVCVTRKRSPDVICSTEFWCSVPRELAEVFLQKELAALIKEHSEGRSKIKEWETSVNRKE